MKGQTESQSADAGDEQAELCARVACDAGDFRSGASLLISAYGLELRTFLFARCRYDESIVEEVFSQFLEDFWRALPQFRWQCSARAWCYVLARHAAIRFHRAPQNRAERRLPLSEGLIDSELVQKLRTETRDYQRSQVKDRFQRLREQLPTEDQELLILRVNRKLPWNDIARVMLDSSEAHDEHELRLKAQALRRRLVEIVRRLRQLASDSGLLPAHD